MPGVRAQNAQPKQPFGPQLKAALIQAAPLFSAMAAGYSSGRGPYAYLDQGIAGMQAMQKQKRDEEAAAAAAAAFGGLVPGGMGPAGAPASAASGGGSVAPVTFDKAAPQYIADDAMAALGKEPLSMEGRIREGLKARGLPEHIANGFIANFKDESNLNPGINEAAPVVPGSRGGFGLAQWTGPRRKALEAFAASQGKPVDDLNVQLDFLMQELSGSEAGAAGAIMSAKNAPEAAAAIVNSFLRPAEEHRSRREAAYLGMEGGAPAQADPLADPYVQKLMQVMAMPGLTDEQRSVVQLQLQTRMGQLSAPDPNADEDRARERRARDAELLGYGRGTPEWNQYVVTGEMPKAATPTDDMREYELAKTQGYTGTFQQYQVDLKKAGAASTTVNNNMGDGAPDLGKLSTDYGYVLDPNTGLPKIDPNTGLPTAAPVPGSPAAMEAAAAGKKAEVQLSGAETASSVITAAADRALEANSNRAVGGLLGAAASYNPSSKNAEVYRQVDVLKANATIENLQAMRNESPTGGALGNVTEGEGRMLQAQAGALDPASPNFERDLLDYTRTLLRTVHGKEVGDAIFEQKYGGGPAAGGGAAPTASSPLPEGITQQEWNAMTPEERALFQ